MLPTNYKSGSKSGMARLAVILLLQTVLVSACGNSFHLRKDLRLPRIYERIQLENVTPQSDFGKAFEAALQEAGGELAERAVTKVRISNLREGKRVVAYTGERKARIYLVFLKLQYAIYQNSRSRALKHSIDLDKTFIYDANFALGKAEEERKIREGLYAEAARLIILKLKHTNGTILQK